MERTKQKSETSRQTLSKTAQSKTAASKSAKPQSKSPPTASKPPRSQTRTASTQPKTDAFALLKDDHKKVKKLYKEFEGLKDREDSDEKKIELVKQLCQEVTIHAQIEEEIFYPAARQALGDEDTLDEADIEHASVKALVSQLERMEPRDNHFDAIVKVLYEYVDHHVQEEEGTMFPMIKKAKVDTKSLGEQIMRRKEQLMVDMEAPAPERKRSVPSEEGARSAHR